MCVCVVSYLSLATRTHTAALLQWQRRTKTKAKTKPTTENWKCNWIWLPHNALRCFELQTNRMWLASAKPRLTSSDSSWASWPTHTRTHAHTQLASMTSSGTFTHSRLKKLLYNFDSSWKRTHKTTTQAYQADWKTNKNSSKIACQKEWEKGCEKERARGRAATHGKSNETKRVENLNLLFDFIWWQSARADAKMSWWECRFGNSTNLLKLKYSQASLNYYTIP